MPSTVQIVDGLTANLKQPGTYMLSASGTVGSGNVITPTVTNATLNTI